MVCTRYVYPRNRNQSVAIISCANDDSYTTKSSYLFLAYNRFIIYLLIIKFNNFLTYKTLSAKSVSNKSPNIIDLRFKVNITIPFIDSQVSIVTAIMINSLKDRILKMDLSIVRIGIHC